MIKPIKNNKLKNKLQEKINSKTKPLGSLGYLEEIAMQIGLIQQTSSPTIKKPNIVVFAADHGIVKSKNVSQYPQEVTTQMVLNFLNGGAAINVFCKQNNIGLQIIDAGVNTDFPELKELINYKIAKGTTSYYQKKAMSLEQCKKAIDKGKKIVEKLHKNGTNCIGFGEMGIGNTSSASLLMSYFTKTDIKNCVGKGTGLTKKGILEKTAILSEVFKFHKPNINNPTDALATFGGYEIAMITGAFLKAAELRMTILVDGFIVSAALLVASAINKNVLDYCIFSHTSNEKGHKIMLQFLKAKPLLNLNLRLGEGTGSALAFPLVQSAVNFLNQMATFKSANVSTAEQT